MPAALLGLLALGLAGAALLGRPRTVLAVLAGTTLLVPATLTVPGAPTSALTITRFVLLAAALGLLVKSRRGQLPAHAFRGTPVHLAWAVYLVVVLVVGVWLAPFEVLPGEMVLRTLDLVDPLLFLVVSLALVRAAGLRAAAVALTVSVTAVALIMVVEHLTHLSWGQFLYADRIGQQDVDAARRLEVRGSGVRVRGASEFALQAGWLLAALLPLLMVSTALRGRLRRAAPFLLALVLLAEVWTVTRSALAGIALGGLTVLLLSRARAAQRLALGLVGLVVIALAVVPGLAGRYSLAIDQGSVDVRGERLPTILDLAAHQPWTGLGLGGLRAAGVPTTDASYLLSYAETGVVGAATLVVLLVVMVVTAGRVLLLPAGRARAIGVAAFAGVLVLLAGAVTFDALQVLQTARLLWLLVAIAVVAAEQALGPAPMPPRPRLWALQPAAVGVALGLGVAALAPAHSAQTSQLLTLPAFREAGVYDPVTSARPVLGNACAFLELRAEDLPVEVSCRDLRVAAGVGQVRIQAADDVSVQGATQVLQRELQDRGLVFASFVPETGIERGKPTLLRTAPVWGGLLGLGLLLLPERFQRAVSGPRTAGARPGGQERVRSGPPLHRSRRRNASPDRPNTRATHRTVQAR